MKALFETTHLLTKRRLRLQNLRLLISLFNVFNDFGNLLFAQRYLNGLKASRPDTVVAHHAICMIDYIAAKLQVGAV